MEKNDGENEDTIKLFNNQIAQLIPDIPSDADTLTDALLDTFPRPIGYTTSPKKDQTVSRFKPL